MFFTFVKHVKHTLTGFRLRHISLVQHWIVPKLLHGMKIDKQNKTSKTNTTANIGVQCFVLLTELICQ